MMRIDFVEGAVTQHPNVDRYFDASVAHGAVHLRFDCAADLDESPESIAKRAEMEFEARARAEGADLLESTLVATWIDDPSGSHRRLYHAIAIAQARLPDPERAIERVELEP